MKAESFYKKAAQVLISKGLQFKYMEAYLECQYFTLTPDAASGDKMWIEDDMGCWVSFTDLAMFSEYLSRRFPAKMPKRNIQ